MQQHILVTVATEGDSRVVADLIIAQRKRQRALDPRLGAERTRSETAATVAVQLDEDEQPLVALDAQGNVRGYALPSVWQVPETSLHRAFLTERNGVALSLALPDPAETDARAVAAVLLAALDNFWRGHGTNGDLIRWPTADPWLEPLLAAQGFQRDSICALHPPQATPIAARSAPSSRDQVRQARPEDEQELVSLFDEELRYHERYTPFVRSSPGVLAAFRRDLTALWNGVGLEGGGPLVLVVERAGEIVAMAENSLVEIGPDNEPGFTAPGRYACIDHVIVREELRRQGIGHELVQATFDAFAAHGTSLDGYLLWYNPDNPQAGHFWPRLGFEPLWTTYQRLRGAGVSEEGE